MGIGRDSWIQTKAVKIFLERWLWKTYNGPLRDPWIQSRIAKTFIAGELGKTKQYG